MVLERAATTWKEPPYFQPLSYSGVSLEEPNFEPVLMEIHTQALSTCSFLLYFFFFFLVLE